MTEPTTERVRIPGGVGAELAGTIERPAGETRGFVLFVHAFGSSKDLRGTIRVARRLAELGFASLRFDFTGLGHSDGRFADTTLATNLDDVEAVVRWLAARGDRVTLIFGHSLGGAAALLTAPRLADVAAFVTLATPSTTSHLRDTLLRLAPALETEPESPVTVAGKTVTIGRQLLDDLSSHDLAAAAASLAKPLLILHSAEDEIVALDHASALYRSAAHPKSFVSLDGADHLLLARERDADFVAELVAAFVARYEVRD